jgi:hypothetical protein
VASKKVFELTRKLKKLNFQRDEIRRCYKENNWLLSRIWRTSSLLELAIGEIERGETIVGPGEYFGYVIGRLGESTATIGPALYGLEFR